MKSWFSTVYLHTIPLFISTNHTRYIAVYPYVWGKREDRNNLLYLSHLSASICDCVLIPCCVSQEIKVSSITVSYQHILKANKNAGSMNKSANFLIKT